MHGKFTWQIPEFGYNPDSEITTENIDTLMPKVEQLHGIVEKA